MDISSIPILKSPYYKGKNFCASPVVKYGIPKFADSSLDPKVIGTPDYLKYWEEQLYYIHNGIQTGGMHIPGRYYYFMNFSTFSTVGGVVTPDMCDLHLELAYLIDYAKANGYNVMSAKGRRKGISEFTQKAVVDYGYRFNPAYQAGIAAGLKDHAEDFMKKWKLADTLIVPEFRIGTVRRNDDEIIAGYQVKEKGEFIIKGTDSKILVRTMHTNPNMFKGLYLNDVIAEECGEFDKLKEFYSATRACLTKGKKQVGTMFFYGTGGNVNKGSKDFREMWNNPEPYKFIKFLIPATRFYFPHYGGATEKGIDVGETPQLLKEGLHKPYQLIGVEDLKEAKESILIDREVKKKGPLKDYLEELQNFPLDEKEIFKKMFSNNFNIEKLNNQADKIDTEKKKYSKWKLEWIKNEKGERAIPLKVIAVVAKDTDEESECTLILDEGHPISNYQNLYVGGIDSYALDQAKSSKSLGAMCVIIRKNTLGGLQMAPVAIICTRPKRKEIFFDMCMKLSVYYNLIGNTLGDNAGSSGILSWYKDNGCSKYLALRPTKFESENSEQSHEYWVSITKHSKPMMIGLMQTNIEDYSHNIWFTQVIEQVGNYDEVEIGSDNDVADAYGIALMQDVSTGTIPRDNSHKLEEDPFSLGDGWEYDKSGNLIAKSESKRPTNLEEDFDRFGMM